MRRPRRSPEAAAPRSPAPAGGPGKGTGRRAHAGPPAEESAEHEGAGAAPGGPGRGDGGGGRSGGGGGGRGRRPRLRPATVRAKIVSLLMVPVVSLLALWGFATVDAAQDIARLSRAQRVDRELRTPVAAAVAELQAERRTAVRLLADPAAAGQATAAQASGRADALDQQARRTDSAVRALRLGDRNTVADSGDYRTDIVVRLRTFVAAAEALGGAREDVTEHRATADAAYETYTRVIDSALEVGGALSGGGRDAELGPDARVLLEFARAAEQLSREDALLAAPGPRSAETLRRLAGAVETRRVLTTAAARDLPEAQQNAWQSVAKSAAYAELTGAEDQALAAPAGSAGSAGGAGAGAAKDPRPAGAPVGWDAAYTSVSGSMREIGDAAHSASAGRSDPFGEGALSPAGIAVVLGLAAVAASLVISVRIGRALVVELVSLRNTALEIAHRKLPHAMERLRAGQDIDVSAETPHGPAAEDEIAQVGEALDTVHRAALSAAVERAELASGVSGVFVNLARRSQVLVHKQLTLLDSMERRADDPSELGDLFRLDHLTTRMRRHAESLIILSGAAPGRAWRTAIPLTNVVRAAVSEIEDYPRVEVRQLAEAAVIGGAVADLTHLLAELIENATQFSPPHTKVRVSGEPVGAGYVLEVEDRGLGMGRESLHEANRRIEQSEALDLFDSDRLGLFVVSRLSARHGVKVHLRMSPYGGTTAVVLLPNSLLQGAITAATPQPADRGERRSRAPVPEPAHESAADPSSERSPAMSVVRDDVRGIPAPGRSGPNRIFDRTSDRISGPSSVRTPDRSLDGRPDSTPHGTADSASHRAPDRGPGRVPDGACERDPGRDSDGSPVRGEPRPSPVASLRPRGSEGASPRTPSAPAVAAARGTAGHGATGQGAAGPGAGSGGSPAASVTELPRRVRQASLVPQLREAPEPREPAGGHGPQDPPGRSPEQARERMAAYRDGWMRGSREGARPGTRPGIHENSLHAGSEGAGEGEGEGAR
ncbi:nitrate- and nitrite sensing domain-containing protein [Streptomyces sp. NPDC006544]|uniref:sensor histidine kinase n=1 Tax=Streptomyces sp. NPDC006544 TaxID=3154583 RepID=UPI0033A678AD